MINMQYKRRKPMNKKQNKSLSNAYGVCRYIAENNVLFGQDAVLKVDEIGNGNMNYVFRITDTISDKTIILKFADGHTRISEAIKVSTDRIRVEAGMLLKQNELVSEYVPKVYLYDEENDCILMEDCKDYTIMRELLTEYRVVQGFSEQITNYLVNSILPTTEFLLDYQAQDRLKAQFENPHLCEITETYVFGEPFNAHSEANAIYEPNKKFIEHEIFEDTILLEEVKRLKKAFRSKKQALLHGDLHTGSIFAEDNSIVIFDFEFAFYGPIGFDLGNLIANLIFAWLHAEADSNRQHFIHWVEDTIASIINQFRTKFIRKLAHAEAMNKLLSKNNINTYLEGVISDTASYAGIELIRRIIGIAHVKDLTSIEPEEKRIRAERTAIMIAKQLIKNARSISGGTDFVQAVRKELLN
jgi:5-methylthioribose kinase